MGRKGEAKRKEQGREYGREEEERECQRTGDT